MSSTKNQWLITAAVVMLIASWTSASPAIAQTPVQPASPEEMEAIYAARADSARMRFSPADVAFVSDMIHHHAQALTMSAMAPTHGASPTVRTLAARIINGQRDEIATMQRWLSERGQPVPEVPAAGGGDEHAQHGAADSQSGQTSPAVNDREPQDHAGHMAEMGHDPASPEHAEHMAAMSQDPPSPEHAEHMAAMGHDPATRDHADMPGMLTPAQLARLDAARGAEFDRLYLASMIVHHEGAITMVEELFATDGALQDLALVKLASEIQAEQRSEIERMSLMLEEMTGSPLGPALIDIQ